MKNLFDVLSSRKRPGPRAALGGGLQRRRPPPHPALAGGVRRGSDGPLDHPAGRPGPVGGRLAGRPRQRLPGAPQGQCPRHPSCPPVSSPLSFCPHLLPNLLSIYPSILSFLLISCSLAFSPLCSLLFLVFSSLSSSPPPLHLPSPYSTTFAFLSIPFSFEHSG